MVDGCSLAIFKGLKCNYDMDYYSLSPRCKVVATAVARGGSMVVVTAAAVMPATLALPDPLIKKNSVGSDCDECVGSDCDHSVGSDSTA